MKRKLLSLTLALVLLLTMGLVTAVPAAAQGETYTVDDDWQIELGAPYAEDTDGDTDFATIQAAIDVAIPFDIITVAPGTYNETIDVTKDNLTIKSQSGNPSDTIIDGSDAADDVANTEVVFINDCSGVTLSGFTITSAIVNFRKSGEGLYMLDVSGCSISNVVVTGIGAFGYGTWAGIKVGNSADNIFDSVTVSDIEATESYGIRVLFGSDGNTFSSTIISGITGSNPTGMVATATGIELKAPNFNSFDSTEITAITSTIGGDPTAPAANVRSRGIYIGGAQNTFTSTQISGITGGAERTGIYFRWASNNSFSEGSITGATRGIYMNVDPNTGNSIHYTNIFGNTEYGVLNEAAESVDATNNWWGDASGPSEVGSGTGDGVSSNVLYNPWLTLAWPPPVEVWVDDDWAGQGDVDSDLTWNTDAFGAIQPAINAVAEDGIVNVAAGTYNESVTVDKALTLLGANVNIDPRGGAWTGDITTINAGAGNDGILITASDVTVNGFKVTGSGTFDQVINSKSGIYVFNESSELTGIVIEYCWGDANYGSGITLRDVLNPTVEYSYFSGNGIGESGNIAGIAGQELNGGSISNNECSNNTNYGIYLGCGGSGIGRGLDAKATSGTVVSSNELHGNKKYGIEIIGLYGEIVGSITVEGNDIHDNERNGMKFTNAKSCTIEDNQFTSNGLGDLVDKEKYKYGVMLSAYNYGTPAEGNLFTGNTFSGNNLGGIYMYTPETSVGSLANTSFHFNNFIEGSGKWGINNTSTYLVDATDNYWGNASGPKGAGLGSGAAVNHIVSPGALNGLYGWLAELNGWLDDLRQLCEFGDVADLRIFLLTFDDDWTAFSEEELASVLGALGYPDKLGGLLGPFFGTEVEVGRFGVFIYDFEHFAAFARELLPLTGLGVLGLIVDDFSSDLGRFYGRLGEFTNTNVNFDPWLLEEVVEEVPPTTYHKTLALKDGWTLVSTDKEVTTPSDWVGTVELSYGETVLAYGYVLKAGVLAFDLVSATALEPVSALYVKTKGGGGVGINYSTGAPTASEKQLLEGWNLISSAGWDNAYAVLSPLHYVRIGEELGPGLATLESQGEYNQFTHGFRLVTLTSGEWAGLRGITLSPYDGYWVYMNAAKSFGVIPY